MSFFKRFAVKLTIRLSSFSNFTFAGFRSCCFCSNSVSNFQMFNLKLKAFVSSNLSVVTRESNSQIPGSFAAGHNSSHRHDECRAITSSLSVCLFLSQPPFFLLSSTTPSHRKPGFPENKRRERGKGHGRGRPGGGG